jgi:hypothetical protein
LTKGKKSIYLSLDIRDNNIWMRLTAFSTVDWSLSTSATISIWFSFWVYNRKKITGMTLFFEVYMV